MEKNINSIVKDTLINLKKKGIDATPNEYHKEFCKVSKTYNLSVAECEQFKELISKLSKNEQIEIEAKGIQTFEDMIPILAFETSKTVSWLEITQYYVVFFFLSILSLALSFPFYIPSFSDVLFVSFFFLYFVSILILKQCSQFS